ncbi:hypothetical protein L3X38_014801 [Prunus dulcis]|uniref:Uncharacterized protein n=1 Tax=Prunus dulcis TaxID=3755 RepID=A0AAD4WRJ5_PRUDU|nr:hypothetical protein L3X38_014801 [Prunus dulcis]
MDVSCVAFVCVDSVDHDMSDLNADDKGVVVWQIKAGGRHKIVVMRGCGFAMGENPDLDLEAMSHRVASLRSPCRPPLSSLSFFTSSPGKLPAHTRVKVRLGVWF